MRAQVRWGALIAACGLLVAVLASRVFYFQELFFAFLLFAAVYLVFLVLAAIALGFWWLYARSVVYLANRAAAQGHRALPLARVLVLWLAPTVARTAEVVSAGQHILFYPFRSWMQGWLHSLRLDASQFRVDAEHAVKHLRLRPKQS
jgi:hypothetical protein